MKKIIAVLIVAILAVAMLAACGDKQKYYIHYYLIGGENNPSNVNVFYAKDLNITLSDPTKEGYTFGGWYTDKNFTNQITEITEAKTQRLYAKWINANGRILTFEDNFDGDELNTDVWSFDTGGGGWGNRELQTYRSSNATVGVNGEGLNTLQIKAEKLSAKVDNSDYASARINTKESFAQTYGRFEARIKLPAVQGMWPAFWLLPVSNTYNPSGGTWPFNGEIDIMEAAGRIPNQFGTTIHYGGAYPHNVHFGQDNVISTPISEWHVYAVEWSEGRIEWYIDDVRVFTAEAINWFTPNVDKAENPNAPFDQDFYIILNLAIGGWYDRDNGEDVKPTDDFTSAIMEVDYVRVYK